MSDRSLEVWLSLLYPPECAFCRAPLRAPGPPRLCGECRAAFRVPRPHCELCAEPFPSGKATVCHRCLSEPPPWKKLLSLGLYQHGSLPTGAILRWKSGGDAVLGAALGRLMRARAVEMAREADGIVPIPGRHGSRIRRGFEPAVILARALAEARGAAPLKLAFLARRPSVLPRPSRRGRNLRRLGAASSYRVGTRAVAGIRGAKLLVVDDVLTTGAAARATAGLLLESGASRVEVVVLARTWVSASGKRPGALEFS